MLYYGMENTVDGDDQKRRIDAVSGMLDLGISEIINNILLLSCFY